MTQHSGLSADRWRRFDRADRVLMIANEMHRGSRLIGLCDRDGLRRAYERVLRLADLTIEVDAAPGFRREALRWRDLAAELYAGDEVDACAHAAALRALLLLTTRSARQLALLAKPDGA